MNQHKIEVTVLVIAGLFVTLLYFVALSNNTNTVTGAFVANIGIGNIVASAGIVLLSIYAVLSFHKPKKKSNQE